MHIMVIFMNKITYNLFKMPLVFVIKLLFNLEIYIAKIRLKLNFRKIY